MTRRLSFYLLTAALAAVCGVVASIWVGYRESVAELSVLRTDVLEDDWSASRARLDLLAASFGVGGRARAGLALIETITAGAPASFAPSAPIEGPDLAYFPLALLLERALAEERYEGTLRAVELLRRSGAPDFPEFEAAAHLELGRPEIARAVERRGQPRTRVARALAEVLSGDLGSVLLRDRRGELLGKARQTAAGEWRFEPERGIDPRLVPVPAVEGLSALVPARSVRLALDLPVAELAARALGSYRGSIVVLDPRDGAVLAAVSDRRTAAEPGTPALEQMREPASIAKIITTTAAMRAGLDVDSILEDMTCRGSLRYDEGMLYCAAINGRLRGLDRALAVSCNVAFAHLGDLVGRRALLEEFERYGFGYPGAEGRFFGRVLEPEGSPRQLGDLSIGLEATAITPVHAALEAAVVANGGWMRPPLLYRGTDTYLGLSERPLAAPEGWQVLDPSWLPRLRQAMVAVAAPGGTAARIAPRSFPVALKTGTASEPGKGFHVNYIGFGPLPEPRVAFAVRVTHQPSSRRVRNAAHAVTRRLLEGLARLEQPRPAQPAAPRPPTVLARLGVEAAGGG